MFTVQEVSKRLGVSRKHVLDLIHSGQLKAINVSQGNRPSYRVVPQSVDGYEERNLVKPAS